jgi:hypothetical protein
MEVQIPDRPRRLRRLTALLKRAGVVVPAVVILAALAGIGALFVGGGDGGDKPKGPPDTDPTLTPGAATKAARKEEKKGGGNVVQLSGVGSQRREAEPGEDAPSPGAPSDAEVRAELREARAALRSFSSHLDTAFLATGRRARVLRDGTAQAPENAPDVVKRVILAGNEIAKFPYKWGGGHGAWRDNGYDCSGSVSFALAGAGLLDRPLASGGFMKWGKPGRGKWITIYANPGHVFMFVAGLRFDTSGRGRAGTRWQEGGRYASGFTAVHPPGL